jgi:hypothetical protein
MHLVGTVVEVKPGKARQGQDRPTNDQIRVHDDGARDYLMISVAHADWREGDAFDGQVTLASFGDRDYLKQVGRRVPSVLAAAAANGTAKS